MARKKWILKIFAMMFSVIMLCIFCPILVFAARSQNVLLNNTITIKALNGVWTNGAFEEVSSIEFPNYVAPGENINLEGGLYLKSEGASTYARFKPTLLLNGENTQLIFIDVSSDWVLGQDGYYYYCNNDNSAQINNNQFVTVINEIVVSDQFKNINSGDNIKISFIAELVEADAESWKLQWGESLPEQWFIASGNQMS